MPHRRPGHERGPASFTVIWPIGYRKLVRAKHREHPEPIRFLWGGQNQATNYAFYGVREGDTIYPISTTNGILSVHGRMTVARVVDRKAYIEDNPADADTITHVCASQVLVGIHGSFVHFDIQVPPEILERWIFVSNTGRRPIKGLVDGKITVANTFQGVYRLSEATAFDLFSLVMDREARSQMGLGQPS